MAKNYVPTANSPIIFHLNKNKLSKSDLCRMLDCTKMTLNNYINDPSLIRLADLHIMAGMFGINVIELVYLLDRCKPQIKKDDKWYLEEIKNKYL